ncbi:non-ribosomal peptide synthetase, partial [Pseudomonas sp. S13.1.2]
AIWADVLKVEQVGRDDNFFSLGGHSLLATQVMARVRSELQIDAPLRALFEAGGLAEFAAVVEQGHADTAPVLTPVDRATSLGLSYAQQRQWFLWQLEPDGTAYNIPSVLHLRGALDLTRLRGAFTRLIDRHEPLRTTFRQEGDRAVQVIHASLPFEVKVDTATDARLWVEAEAKRPFDLLQGPLLRVRLLQLTEDDHVLVLTLHHIVADGQSMPVLVDELVQFYQGVELPPLAIQYADFAAWQRQWMEAGEKARQLSYWTQQLGGEQPVLELPLDRPRQSMQDNRGAALPVALEADLSRSLKALARAQGVTLAQLLLASFQLLLARYSGQSDIRVGMPIANRTRLETERLIGFFVNTQVLKAEFDGELTVSGLLAQVKRTAIEAQAHQDLPFEQLVEALAPARNLGISPLFQAMFNHQTELPSQTPQPKELSVTPFDWTVGSTHFDLSLDTFEGGTGLSASFTYATALFDPGTITRFAQHWCALLQAMVAAPEARVLELPLLSAHEIEQVLPTLDARDTIALEVKPVHLRIEEQAAARPDEVALICEGHHLTYSQLNRRANRLAHQLRHAGVGPEVLVGLSVERGLDMVVGLLAILKAGGAYVPLDPQYPRDRLGYMVEDSGVELLLTQRALREQLQMPAQVRCLYVDDGSDAGFAESNPASLASPDNLAYVMYTSGSTGRPKGVAINHRSLATHTQVTVRFARLTPADRFLQFATLNFDGFVEQLYPALSIGASVVIRGPEIWDSETFYRQLIEQRITHCDLTTAYWFMLVQDFAAVGARPYGELRQVHIGGEAMPPEGIEAWRQAGLGDVALINTYGPTEATVVVTTFDCGPLVHANAALPAAVPIGQTLPGRVIRVLDDQGQTALPRARGELLIGGQLLARGYFQRPAMTAERFIPDPFSVDGARLYRSGDLATYTVEGRLDYAGRLDHQVKIRGLRIELGEIEAHILADVSVREAVVLAVEGALGKQLVAYVVPSALGDDPRLALRSTLRANLPDYMVPGAWILMAALPLSPNGKLDRRALPAPDFAQSHIAYVEPRTALEVDLARIWSQVLEAERVGLEDNFFELGGHSLLATRVVSTLRTEQGLDVPLRLLFEHPTLGEFAQAIETQATSLSDDGLAEIEQLMNEWAEI